ncbi:polyubiquitin 9 [Planoprotostelium fungivorum]|uniref:Polyubiquitin 9 n=1 Tax=Planoprotostelium fungivorum TaxID=1890364 RepID=A0A2P6N9L8_9EUKA|nr:polyubiquitin 9 [Planoprotostelium fungivorum]
MFIKTATRKVFLDVDINTTIQRLKQEIELLEGIPTSEQRLIFAGRQLLDGDKTLSEYGLTTPDQTLLMLRQTNSNRNITLYVRTIQRELDFKLSVSLSDEVNKIRSQINERVNLPSSYSLVYNGIVLENHQTVLDYGIVDRASVYIVTQIVMEVENLNGERIKMKINDHRVTGEVVERLVEQRRSYKNQQRKRKHIASTEDNTTPDDSKRPRNNAEDELETSEILPSSSPSSNDVAICPNGDCTLPSDAFLEIKESDLQTAPRCNKCSKKIGLTGIQCRCNHHFCSVHRYPEEHECPFDYRTKAREELAKQNPRVAGTKIIPIAK